MGRGPISIFGSIVKVGNRAEDQNLRRAESTWRDLVGGGRVERRRRREGSGREGGKWGKRFFDFPFPKIEDGRKGSLFFGAGRSKNSPSSKNPLPPYLSSDLRTDLRGRRSKMGGVLHSSEPEIEDRRWVGVLRSLEPKIEDGGVLRRLGGSSKMGGSSKIGGGVLRRWAACSSIFWLWGFFVLRSRKIEETPSSKNPRPHPRISRPPSHLLSDLHNDLRSRRSKMGVSSIFGTEDRKLKMGGSSFFGSDNRRR